MQNKLEIATKRQKTQESNFSGATITTDTNEFSKTIVPLQIHTPLLHEDDSMTVEEDIVLKPLCACGEEANSFVVRKEGPNKGRRFYCCARDQKDDNRCKYFKFHSDLVNPKVDPFEPKGRATILHETIYTQQMMQDFVNKEGSTINAIYSSPSKKLVYEKTARDSCIEEVVLLAKRNGWETSMASCYEQVYYYKDLHITQGFYQDVDWWLYIQPATSIELYAPIQYDYVWVQVHGVHNKKIPTGKDDKGWVMDGQADLIVFEQKDGYMFIDRKILWMYIDTLVDKIIVQYAKDADHKWYKCVHANVSPYEVRTLLSVEKLKDFNDNRELNPTGKKLIVDFWKK